MGHFLLSFLTIWETTAMSGRVENKKSRTHKSYKQLRVPLLKTVDKIYFNFGIFYNKIIDEKPISSGYRVKSNGCGVIHLADERNI